VLLKLSIQPFVAKVRRGRNLHMVRWRYEVESSLSKMMAMP
jgi:hypothetical protein